MISAFGVEHSSVISKMSDAELRHRKRVQAGLSTAGATVGLAALGTKGAKIGVKRYLKPAEKAVRVNTKIDQGVNNALVVGGGIGGAAGLNSASISRAEGGKKKVKKNVEVKQTGSNQHKLKNQIQITTPRLGPKGRRHVALGLGTASLAAASLAAGTNKKRALGLIGAGSGLTAYAASEPGEKHKMSKSAFGVDHGDISKADKSTKTAAGAGAAVGAAGGYGLNRARRKNLAVKAKNSSNQAHQHLFQARMGVAATPDNAAKHIAMADSHARQAGQLVARAHSTPRKIALVGAGAALGATAGYKSQKGKRDSVDKSFDSERRRHTQLGAAAGVAGSTSVVAGASAAKHAKVAHGHFRAASESNETVKSRLLGNIPLKGGAQQSHSARTARTHGEMLTSMKAGNNAARKARGRAGVALGTAAAAGAIAHHSANGGKTYSGPYQRRKS